MSLRTAQLWVVLAVVALIVAACGGQAAPAPATPQVVKETVVVEKEVTKQVEVEVTRVVPKLIEVTSTPNASASPTAEAAAPAVKRGGKLVILNRASPKSLVSIIDPGKPGIGILHNTQDGLLNFNETYTTIYPAIAKDFPENPDPLTYIFHLREGVKFHDGKEVTSADVEYTFHRLLDKSYGATFGQVYRDNIDSIETPDKYTVIFHLKQEWPLFLSFVGGNHPKIVEKELAEKPEYGKSVWSGTGPFMIKEWVPGDHVTIVRNPNYWNAGTEGYPYLDEVVFREIPEASAEYAALAAGEGDVITEPEFKDITRFQDDPKYQVSVEPSSDSTVLVFNTARPPFDDQKVRLAISKGIDRQEIVDTLFFGYATPAGDFFPPFHWAHDDSVTMPYDPDGAKQLLKEAGYDESHPLKFTLMPRTEALFADQAVLIQAQLAKIGVQVDVKPVEYTTLSGMTAGKSSEWAGDAGLYRITPLRGTAFEFSYYQYGAKGALNRTYFNQEGGFQDPAFEKALQEANSYSDYDAAQREKAAPLYSEVSKMWLEDAPGLLLNWWANADILRPEVEGWVSAVGDIMSLKQVWVDK
ncbi:MAG: ABC transporter substrate-binding protein [Ardenticatenaceae bacterium]|nr:ABC transporter substrate-binding protein [Ardenticatenaceae bacterium]